MRCDNCIHWKADSESTEWEALQAGFGECAGVRTRWRIMDGGSENLAWCAADDAAYEAREDGVEVTITAGSYTAVRIEALKKARAYVQDGSEYRAELFTAPDFFCALHTPLPHAAVEDCR